MIWSRQRITPSTTQRGRHPDARVTAEGDANGHTANDPTQHCHNLRLRGPNFFTDLELNTFKTFNTDSKIFKGIYCHVFEMTRMFRSNALDDLSDIFLRPCLGCCLFIFSKAWRVTTYSTSMCNAGVISTSFVLTWNRSATLVVAFWRFSSDKWWFRRSTGC